MRNEIQTNEKQTVMLTKQSEVVRGSSQLPAFASSILDGIHRNFGWMRLAKPRTVTVC